MPAPHSGMTELINGNFQDAEGNALALGYITMQLNQDAQSSQTSQVTGGRTITITLDSNGNANTGQYVWPNNALTPATTYYTVKVYSAVGQLVYGPNYLLVNTAPTFDMDTWVPNQIGVGPGNVGDITLQANGVNLALQNLLNLESTNSSITITDEGNGSVNLEAVLPTPLGQLVNFATASATLAGNTTTGAAGINAPFILYIDIPYAITFTEFDLIVDDSDDGSTISDVGFYSVTGTLLGNIGGITGVTVNANHLNTFSLQAPLTLQPGRYIFATCATSNTGGFGYAFGYVTTLGTFYYSTTPSVLGVLQPSITVTSVTRSTQYVSGDALYFPLIRFHNAS